MKNNLKYLGLIFIFASFIRLLYASYEPAIIVSADTYGYYELGITLWEKDFFRFFVNDARTPLYPLFLAGIIKLKNHLLPPLLSPQFFEGAFWVIFFQQIMGILSLFFVFFLLKNLKIKTAWAYFFTLFLGLNPLIFSWERKLLTESLATFFLVLISFFFFKTLLTKKYLDYFCLFFLLVFIFLLKPFYLFLPFLIFPLIPFFHRTKISLVISLVFFLGYLIVPLSYMKINEINYGYFGLNRSGDINLLGKILKYKLPVENGKEIEFFFRNVKDYQEKNGNPHPYRFLETYDAQIYEKTKILNLLPRFNQKVITSNFPTYFRRSLEEIPSAINEVSELIAPWEKNTFLGQLFSLLFVLFQKFQLLFFLVFFLFPFSLFFFLQRNTLQNTAIFFFNLIALYQIFFAVFFSYGEFGRLISCAQPIIYLFLFLFFLSFFSKFSQKTFGKS